ncbi:ANTAR domain-containing protein [Streptomyces sp. NPDC005963]|uniref:ANTAR domain-containing protein n=1 Tax=Streptomyces sp. NPDC005963 TaxID=3156721 RepID=UPI0033E7A11C
MDAEEAGVYEPRGPERRSRPATARYAEAKSREPAPPTCPGAAADHRAHPDPSDLGVEELRDELAGLRKALASHPVIDMARGIVMATMSCTPDDAWQILVRVSQHSNTKLREVARHIVEGTHGPPPPPQVCEALRQVYVTRARRAR